ncbi:MAG: guanylate kinase [Bacteroidetes bacterium]|nr:MAG: guanylate kinase [Bacteroidota bacterium]
MTTPAGKIIIITAPSGAGKTSITRHLLQQMPQLQFSISATTRQPRATEQHGHDYYFLSEQDFTQRISDGDFLEWEMVYHGKYYGTLRSEVSRIWAQGCIPILDIDVKGAIHVQQQYPGQTLALFIEAPSIDALAARLQQRGTETPETIQTRLNKAAYELSFKNHFDHVIVNNQLPLAQAQAMQLVANFLGLPPTP